MNNRCLRVRVSLGSTARTSVASRLGCATLAAVALALASCWHPAFDPAISGSEAVIRKLGAPIFESSTYIENGYEMEDAWFLPTSSNPITAGALFRRDVFRVRISSGTAGAEAINVFGDLYTAYTVPSGGSTAFLASEPTVGRSITPLNAFPNPLPTSAYPAAITATFGIGLTRTSMMHQARCAWIGYNDVLMPAYNTCLWDAGAAPGFGAAINLPFPDHALVRQPGTAFWTPGYLYLSCGLSDGSRAIYRWEYPPSVPPPVRFPEVYGPLVGALSDGRLLAQKGEILTVLDADLNREFSFPAGKLRFVHERWDTFSTMYSVFTRTIFVRTERDNDGGRLDVEVYEIPTLDLYKLAD